MASSATDSQGKDRDIREGLIKTGHVDAVISVGQNFFYTKSLPCSLWFFDKGKQDKLKDKVLFIDARNYFTAVDRTLNEWSEWQLKNLNAIVWLYRGETEKYTELLREYHSVLGDQPFEESVSNQEEIIKALHAEAKDVVNKAAKKDRKKIQADFDEKITTHEEVLQIAKEAVWLYAKFQDGKYHDISGLCKIAEQKEIEDKNFSLTPGAYVGVAPVEDDGIDFHERMAEIHTELLKLQKESNSLIDAISQGIKEMGI